MNENSQNHSNLVILKIYMGSMRALFQFYSIKWKLRRCYSAYTIIEYLLPFISSFPFTILEPLAMQFTVSQGRIQQDCDFKWWEISSFLSVTFRWNLTSHSNYVRMQQSTVQSVIAMTVKNRNHNAFHIMIVIILSLKYCLCSSLF